MAYLKQHRKGTLELEGRKLSGHFDVSLTNQGDREVLTEFISEMRKALIQFDPAKKKRKKVGAKKRPRKKVRRTR